MYYSNEHIKDLSTYKTPPPALVRPTVPLFPLSPQFCCEKVMKHWRSSVMLLNLKPQGILGPQMSLKCPSVWTNPSAYHCLSSYRPSPEHRFWINQWASSNISWSSLSPGASERLKTRKDLISSSKKCAFMHLKRKLLWKWNVYFHMDPSEGTSKGKVKFPRNTFTSQLNQRSGVELML